MPQSPEAILDYEAMLEELADVYPQLKSKAMELKDDVMDLMPEDEEPVMEPELDLEEGEEELELEL